MANLRQARRRVYIVLAVLLAVDIAAAVVLLTPFAGSGSVRQQEFEAVRRQVQHKMQRVIPPNQVQSRVDEARAQIDSFYKNRLPGGSAALTRELGQLAAASGVRFNAAHYRDLDSDLPSLAHLRIDASISGEYANTVKFINAVERDKMFFIVNGINLGEQQGGNVRLEVALETYLMGGGQ